MNPIFGHIDDTRHPCTGSAVAGKFRRSGFVLITLLMLMVLLLIIGIGLLSLSTISMRSGSQGEAAAIARANARLALQLAIAELQSETGPDQRVTATADQIINGTDANKSASMPTRRHWTGVYRSWSNAETQRPAPEFLAWLVSGQDSDVSKREFATTVTGNSDLVQLVGPGSVGDLQDGYVEAPLMKLESATRGSRYAWWVADQGTKAALVTPAPATATDQAATRAALQSASRNAAEVAATASGGIPFADLAAKLPKPGMLTGWKQAELVASTPTSPKPLFHDLSAHSAGLLTNVRSGGFRKDLSFHLEKSAAAAPRTALYEINGKAGINESELWLYYNLWRELKTGSSQAYTTGGTIASSAPYLQVEGDKAKMTADPEYLYKQPTVISYQTILSFHVRPVTVNKQAVKRLTVVVDPIVTLWNPLDVPVVVTPAFNSIKYCQLPYDLTIKRPSGDTTVSLCRIQGGSDIGWQYLTLLIGKTHPVIMKPGEVLMYSQGARTEITSFKAGHSYIDAQPGWNFGGGIAFDIRTADGKFIETTANETFTYEIKPNSLTSYGTQDWILTGNGLYYKNVSGGESYGLGGLNIDFIEGLPSARIRAADRPDFFDKIKNADTRPLTFDQLVGRKEPFMRFAFNAKTESDSERQGRFLSRFNPKSISTDFQTLRPDELEALPFEVKIDAISDFRNIAVNETGQSYFGGGATAQNGSNVLTTHSIPREPITSLAAFQNAFANGFTPLSSPSSLAMLPQISHAIGNSTASPVIPADKTSSTLEGPRILADHSYLANEALWDTWFLSGAAPQTAEAYSNKRTQSQVAREFLNLTEPLANNRYLPSLQGLSSDTVHSKLFSGEAPKSDAHLLMASYLVADGMFNINSTSVEAWKCVLSGLKDKPVATRDPATGKESTDPTTGIPATALISPENQIAKSDTLDDVSSRPQWVGRRVLSDGEITALATAIVREVRKRGPFTSLADFVNRRPGTDESLARSGAIQSALDAADVPINSAYNTGSRSADLSGSSEGLIFPKAEEGPAAFGIPGVVKQGDILTPIAPYISARSDTFLIRTYGDCLDASGKVVARAWCEAEVQRESSFVDPANPPETETNLLNFMNQRFGRRYQIVSFRWLAQNEI